MRGNRKEEKSKTSNKYDHHTKNKHAPEEKKKEQSRGGKKDMITCIDMWNKKHFAEKTTTKTITAATTTRRGNKLAKTNEKLATTPHANARTQHRLCIDKDR